ncbi:hypothetical protein [Microbacterium sp. SD291]|uniref:maleate cis-trans isomerase family protein n=1 Tax=Microbacterium sp. SD291 TaxID=2782007 RepID=UPI001A9654A9|nr:hypothetical protein [Microbacterium sp. SD291]MBO0980093.1 Asp/Glu/hydantoin racemase [Microbacterium sp. SD291]
MSAPGPRRRLGILVPSSNSNAESSLQRMLAGRTDVSAHASRFRLPASLSDRIDAGVLGEAPELLADLEPDAVAFHGTSGSWTGFEGDRELAARLEDAVGAPATTASLAVREALDSLRISRVGLVFPGPPDIAAGIAAQYGADGIEVVRTSTPDEVLSNAEIGRADEEWIAGLMQPAFDAKDIDGVMCIGTNLRSAYLVDSLERVHGIPVVDSASAVLWRMLQLAGANGRIAGWGRLLAS